MTRSWTHVLQIINRLAQVPMIHFDFQLYVIIITVAWVQSGPERIHRCTGYHTLSPCLFLHTCLRNRGKVLASLWLTGLLTRHLVAKAGRRAMIHVTRHSAEGGTMVFCYRHLSIFAWWGTRHHIAEREFITMSRTWGSISYTVSDVTYLSFWGPWAKCVSTFL